MCELDACHVLVVSRDAEVCARLADLARPRLRVVLAPSAIEALRLLEQQPISGVIAAIAESTALLAAVEQQYPEVSCAVLARHSSDVPEGLRQISPTSFEEDTRAFLAEVIRGCRRANVLRTLRQRIEASERTLTLGILASGIAHDLRQPLSLLGPALALLREDVEELGRMELPPAAPPVLASLRQSLEEASLGTQHLSTLADTLLEHVRAERSSIGTVSVRGVVDSALVLCRASLYARASVEVEIEEDLFVRASPSRLTQLIVNLLVNAAQALAVEAERPGRVRVRGVAEGPTCVLWVEDNGPGIPAHLHQRIFSPLFTTKGAAGGCGLGLAVCAQVAEEAGGSIRVHSAPHEGARFEVRLPLCRPDESAP